MGDPQDRRELVASVRAHTSQDPTAPAALNDLRALEASLDFKDPESTLAAARLRQARMSALPQAEQGTDLVATVVLFSFVLASAPALVPANVREALARKPPPPPAFGLSEWASLALDDAIAARDQDGVEHALMLATRAEGEAGFADARLVLLNLRVRGYHHLFQWTDDPDHLDRAIDLGREYGTALEPTDPEYAGVWSDLANVLVNRGRRTASDEDLNEAVECASRAVTYAPGPQLRARFLSNLATALTVRSAPEDGEKAIEVSREAVALTAADNPARPIRLTNLGSALGKRHRQTSEPALVREAVVVFREAVALSAPDDPRLEARKANLAAAEAALASDPPPQHSRPPPWRSSFNRLRQRFARWDPGSRPRSWLHRLEHRIDLVEYRHSSYLRRRPVPNLLQGMYAHAIGGPVAGAQSAAAMPPRLVGLGDILHGAGHWLGRRALWTAAGVLALVVVLQAAELSWVASAVALALGAAIDWLLVGRGSTLAHAMRFCPVGTTVFMALLGAGFTVLAALACIFAGVHPEAAALAAASGWAATTTAIIKPAIAAELAFARGEPRNVALPAQDRPGGVSMMRVHKDSIVPMFASAFDDEFEPLLVDTPGADPGRGWAQALTYARRESRGALAVAGLVAAAVAVIAAVFLVIASQLSLGVALLCAAAAGLLAGIERLRRLVEAELRMREIDDQRAPRPSVSFSPLVVERFAQFGGRGPVGESFVTPGNRPGTWSGSGALAGAEAEAWPPVSDDEEVWE
jgi:tetratricopeptide (TPR) repeat protein